MFRPVDTTEIPCLSTEHLGNEVQLEVYLCIAFLRIVLPHHVPECDRNRLDRVLPNQELVAPVEWGVAGPCIGPAREHRPSFGSLGPPSHDPSPRLHLQGFEVAQLRRCTMPRAACPYHRLRDSEMLQDPQVLRCARWASAPTSVCCKSLAKKWPLSVRTRAAASLAGGCMFKEP